MAPAESREKAGTTVADGMEKTAQYLREHDTQQMVNDVEQFVREHPTQAVVGAVAPVSSSAESLGNRHDWHQRFVRP